MKIGDKAPNFKLKDQNGKEIISKQLRGKKITIFFYPKDNTLICTKEACSFRDNYEEFKSYNTEVIGVSGDSDISHQEFASKFSLQYSLVHDSRGDLARAFGVRRLLGILPGRTSFLIDENGIILAKETSRFGAHIHIETLLNKLKSIS